MKKFLLAALICCAACAPAPEESEETFTITFDSTEINVPSQGGYARAPYSFTGDREHLSSLTVDCESGWIAETVSDVPGELIVSVQANPDTTDRVAVLDVAYDSGTEQIYIVQQGNDPQQTVPSDDEGSMFGIEIFSVKESSVTYGVFPSDPSMTYINLVTEKEFYDSFQSDEARFEYDMAYFNTIAQQNGLTLGDILASNLKTGNVNGVTVCTLAPESDYYIYVYGLTVEGERLTDYVSEPFTTESIPFVDIDFELNPVVDGNHVVLEIYPSDDVVPYVCDAYIKAGLDIDGIRDDYQAYIDQVISVYEMLGQTAEDAVKSIAHIGPDAIAADLTPNLDYVGFAVSISLSGFLNSEVSICEFSTGNAKPSDNVITIEMTKIESDYAEYAITTTTSDPYALAALDAAQFEGLSDQQIISALIDNNLIQTASGNATGSLSPLRPDTEYAIFAFGYSGGVVTTGLFSKYFVSASAASSAAGQCGTPALKIDRKAPVPVLNDYGIE